MIAKRSTRVFALAAGAVLALGLTGCGGGDKDKDSSPSDTSTTGSSTPTTSPSATPKPPIFKGLTSSYPKADVPLAHGTVKRSSTKALTSTGQQVDGWTVQLSFPGTLANAEAKVNSALTAKGFTKGTSKHLGGQVQEIVYTGSTYENRVDFIPIKANKKKKTAASVTVLYNITKK